MSTCEQGSHWQQALQFLAEMQAQGLGPSGITYDAVSLSASGQGLQRQQALKPLAEMQAQGLELSVN